MARKKWWFCKIYVTKIETAEIKAVDWKQAHDFASHVWDTGQSLTESEMIEWIRCRRIS